MVQDSLKQQIREKAENSLEAFIRLVHPHRVLGDVHKDLIGWWERNDASSHQLVLLPRDHQKSALLAYRVAWTITKNPAIRVHLVNEQFGDETVEVHQRYSLLKKLQKILAGDD